MTQIGELLKNLIYVISSSLFYPVLILLVLVFGYIVYASGSLFSEWLERTKLRSYDPETLRCLLAKKYPIGVFSARVERYANVLREYLSTLGQSSVLIEEAVENLLQQEILRSYVSTDRLRILVKIAPALGLIGTLIPMGSGLKSLGQGDLSGLSDDLIIAFTTTVVGLTAGIVAFFLSAVKRRWIERDVGYMELISEVLVMKPERHAYALHQETSDGSGRKLAG